MFETLPEQPTSKYTIPFTPSFAPRVYSAAVITHTHKMADAWLVADLARSESFAWESLTTAQALSMLRAEAEDVQKQRLERAGGEEEEQQLSTPTFTSDEMTRALRRKHPHLFPDSASADEFMKAVMRRPGAVMPPPNPHLNGLVGTVYSSSSRTVELVIVADWKDECAAVEQRWVELGVQTRAEGRQQRQQHMEDQAAVASDERETRSMGPPTGGALPPLSLKFNPLEPAFQKRRRAAGSSKCCSGRDAAAEIRQRSAPV